MTTSGQKKTSKYELYGTKRTKHSFFIYLTFWGKNYIMAENIGFIKYTKTNVKKTVKHNILSVININR